MTVAGHRTVGGLWRDFLGIVASLSALIALPFLFGAIFLGLVSLGVLSGWEVAAGPTGPTTLGFVAAADGPVIASLPSCHRRPFQILLLLDGDDTVLWQAEAAEPVLVTQFFVGMPPTGFTDRQPLGAALDPAKTYTVIVLPQAIESDDALSYSEALRELNDGAEGSFTPGDLDPEQMLVGGETRSQEEFDSSCDD